MQHGLGRNWLEVTVYHEASDLTFILTLISHCKNMFPLAEGERCALFTHMLAAVYGSQQENSR